MMNSVLLEETPDPGQLAFSSGDCVPSLTVIYCPGQGGKPWIFLFLLISSLNAVPFLNLPSL